ncbi:MAG: hypothetical protein JZU65_15500 [Chlorobium sp.]|nr:hypothetical protein [Chlorobium sp.]
MKTLLSPEDQRFGLRINQWFDFTNRFRTQLFDQEKTDDLKVKTSEHASQVRLQKQVGIRTAEL